MTEILAPAGGREQLMAAVRCGADAVYLGAGAFNARRNAENFDGAGLPEAVSYCHGRGVRVHVAVNTLVTDSELPALLEELEAVAASGADAVIVQDLAVAALIRERCPGLVMHGSTQMTIHDLAGARELEALGFSRVVLARELSLDEIKKIAAGTSIELECFVHGALCMCVSGGCYLSAMLGGRSGNRGLCAQPCRLDFRSGAREYALSLKDMSYVQHIRELSDAGVCSLKIEGRMKRPEYVAAAVTACREALEGRTPDMETLRSVFSRGGFTDGYLTGKRNLAMFGHREKEDVTAAEKVLRPLSLLYKDERSGLPVSMALELSEGRPARLTVSDGEHSAAAQGALCQSAERRPTDRELAERSLSKCGGTPFYLKELEFISVGSPALPARELNELRRRALDELLARRSAPSPLPFHKGPLPRFERHMAPSEPELRVRAEKYEQLSPEMGAAAYILPLRELERHPQAVDVYGERLVAELPALIWPGGEEPVARRLEALRKAGIPGALGENLGALRIIKEAGLTAHGGAGLNILNSLALEEYARLGLGDVTVSFELAMAKFSALGGQLPRGLIAAGQLPLMRCRACPIQTERGCGGCSGEGALTDRRGEGFPVLCTEKGYISLLNPVPLWLGDKELRGADFVTLYFTVEAPAECMRQTAAFREGLPFPRPMTRGLYYRELK